MKTIIYIITPIVLLVTSCVNTHKLIQEGNYQTAFDISLTKLKNNKIKSTDIDAFSISFAMLEQADKTRINELKSSGRTDIWPAVFEEANSIIYRQEKIKPILNRLSRAGIDPAIDLYDAYSLREEAREKSAIYFYAKSQQYLVGARNGDRQAARKAFYALKRSTEFIPDYKDTKVLMEEMYDLGTSHILMETHLHPSNERLDAEIYGVIFGNKQFPKRYDWQMVHLIEQAEQREYHYKMDLFLDNYWVSGNDLSSSTCTNSIEVKVGEKTVKEWSEKDSCYIEVVEEIFETVTGSVTIYNQYKAGSLDLIVEISSLEEEKELRQEILQGSSDWSNDYSEESGDSRAADACDSVIGFCSMYPSRREMLRSAASSVRSGFYSVMTRQLD